jgi:hypothetical protein
MTALSRIVAICLLSAAAPAAARTLTLTATRIASSHASVSNLRVVIEERTAARGVGAASVQLDAANIAFPELALDGRLAWRCDLQRDAAGTRSCSGPVHLTDARGGDHDADLTVRLDDERLGLSLQRAGSSVALNVPLQTQAPTAVSLQQVPADWLRPALAQAWKGGELRGGLVDANADVHADGRIVARYTLADLAFNTFDGTVSGTGLALTGTLETTTASDGRHLVGAAQFSGGSLHAGAARIDLPDAAVEADLDMRVRADSQWEIARLAWRDNEALTFEADGMLDPAALAPLRSMNLRIQRAQFPLVLRRYAGDVLKSYGIGASALKGELAGEIALDEHGLQRIRLTTPSLSVATDRFAMSGIHGGIDWAAEGERPGDAIAWKSARIDGFAVPSASSRWQSRDGNLLLLGKLQTKLFGGEVELSQAVLNPRATTGERLRTKFAVRGIGYDSKDGTLAASHIAADGTLKVFSETATTRVQLSAQLRGGETLVGPFYMKLPALPVSVMLDASVAGANVQLHAFDWNDAGSLAFGANGDFSLADEHPLHALQVDLREARLDSAIDRYARSWLASKGYPELSGSGLLSGSLKFDRDGLQHLAFAAHAVDLHDGGGRFAFAGVEGGVDWEFHRDTPASSLAWRSIELLRIPLGSARAAFESRNGAIVLAQPLSVDVLGGQVRLETLSLQPRSPRGDRYAGSFALVGLEMPQISAALGWPAFPGNLSGGIPEIEFSGDTIALHGGLDLYVFDGHLGVSGLALERPFGVAPSLAADIHFENFDLEQLTSAFSLGGMSGRLDGTIAGLRLLDWSPVALDAWLRTNGGGRMSYKAVNDITTVGGGGGLSANLQTMALQIFDTFGYRALGMRCRLIDDVCAMGGIDPLPPVAPTSTDATDDGYTMVEGSGLPRIRIIGHRRRVDWPTLVRRLQEATHGQVPVIK